MTINIYQCDTCDREIELLENKKGLDFIQRCIITHGCRGKLFKLTRKVDFIRNNLPDDVEGLDNRIKRSVLYNHTQSLQSSKWLITHNLGINPSVQVFVNRTIDSNTDLVEIEPENITIVDKNNISVSFLAEETGVVQCLSKSSRDTTKTNVTPSIITTNSLITSNSELTVATLNNDASIDLELEFTTTNGTINQTYTIDNVASTKSAWVDLNTILFKGKQYTVRSTSILTPDILNDIINNGSTIRAITINNISINEEDIIVLLANKPFTTFDKNTNHYIDINDTIINNFSLFYKDSEFYVNDNIISNIFPPLTQ